MDANLKQLIMNFSSELINSVPEFQDLHFAKKELEADPVSRQLWKEKEEMRETIDLMKSKGLPISESQQQELSQKLKEIRENAITFRYLRAINFASKVSGKIGADLNDTIGADFSPRRGCD